MIRAYLLREPFFLVCVGVTVAVLTPYFFISQPELGNYASLWADLPLVAMAVLASLVGVQRERSWAERRFWYFTAAAMGAWLCVRIVYISIPDESWYEIADLVTDSLYLAFYLLLILALDVNPEARSRPNLQRSLVLIRQTGATLFGFGLLFYFVIIPHTLDYDRYWTWVPSLVFYVFLDGYLVLRFYALFRNSDGGKWRAVFGGFVITSILWMSTDLIELLMYMEAIPWTEDGSFVDFIWYLPFVSFFTTVRSRGAQFPPSPPKQKPPLLPSLLGRVLWAASGGPLVGYAFAFPLIHFLTYLLTGSNEQARTAREVLVLISLAGLGGLALLQQRLMDRERRRYDTDLTRLAASMLRQHEEERHRLAMELHDETAQVFTAVRMKLGVIREAGSPDAEGLDRALELIDDGIRSIRNVTRDLRPALLDEMGLMPALNALIETVQEEGINVTLRSPESIVGLTSEAELTVFRMVQEGLTNVFRHSDAEKVTVTLVIEKGQLSIEIADDGKITGAAEAQIGRGMGLAGMRERVTMVGGSLNIIGGDGVGWTLRAIVPLSTVSPQNT